MAAFEYPETNSYRALSAVSKTRRLPDGSFEACAALFFGGKRLNQAHATAATRYGAEKYAMQAIGARSK